MADKEPLVSIIIPVNIINDFIRKAVSYHLTQTYPNLEILIFPDEISKDVFPSLIRVIPTGKVSPAEKRDLALRYAWGKFLAFTDDDAYPHPRWLENALPWFEDPELAAVCGPGVTPISDSVLQRAGGWVCASPLGSGGSDLSRFLPNQAVKEVDDWPSMNLIVRRADFSAIDGFDNSFWPGEDTKLCLDLTRGLGKKIIYDPDVLVYHHRRALFGPHLKQHGRYGLHRGYFARILPETSRRIGYFGPVLSITYGALWVVWIGFRRGRVEGWEKLSFLPFVLYGLLLLLNALWIWVKSKDIQMALLSIPGVFATHVWYGLRFMQGLLVNRIGKNRSDK